MTIREATDFLQALAVPSIALLGTAIASAQAFIAWQKLKLDLFEKRFAVFEAYRKLMGAAIRNGTVPEPDLYEFGRGILNAELLFGDEVVEYLNSVRIAAIELNYCRQMLADQATQDRPSFANQSAALMRWLIGQDRVASQVFRPYLRFNHRDLALGRRASPPSAPPLLFMRRN